MYGEVAGWALTDTSQVLGRYLVVYSLCRRSVVAAQV